MRLNFAVLAFAAMVGAACNCGGPPTCKVSTDCGGAQVCLETQVCAVACSSDTQCLAAEKCSAAGGCVAKDSCGADRDCSGNLICDSSKNNTPAQCDQRCETSGCGAGNFCATSGHCLPVGADGGQSCGGQLFAANKVQANMLIVLDHSGSMADKVGGTQKWASAVTAVKQVTSANDAIRFGLDMFSTNQMHCDPGSRPVPVGDNTAALIAAALPADANGDGTPIAAALALASAEPALVDTTRNNYVLLVTDGQENCKGNPVQEVTSLAAKGVKTYVVGFGGEVDAKGLSAMATAGGTARAGAQKYYQADNAADLQAALSTIAKGAIGCGFTLTQSPPDANKIFVYVNGGLAPHDTKKVNGWDYDSATKRLTLYGTVCDYVANNASANVSIVYGCPDDSIIEGGGNTTPDAGKPDFGEGGNSGGGSSDGGSDIN